MALIIIIITSQRDNIYIVQVITLFDIDCDIIALLLFWIMGAFEGFKSSSNILVDIIIWI